MCDPFTITAVTLAVAASAASVAQQQQASKTQNAYEKIAYGQRKEAALETFTQLREREMQERAKAAQDIEHVTSQARRAAASAQLNALESGTGGQSVNLLLENFQRGELANVGVVQSNLGYVQRQIRAQETAAGRIQGPATAIGPLDSPLGIAASTLNVASAGFNAYGAAKPTPPVAP